MSTPFNAQFDQHGSWRRDFARQLHQLRDWLSGYELLDAAVDERLQRLQAQVRGDKVTVAFVAEFSRGKSELINAVFFAAYGRRLMPAGAGRTTMCPAELGWDEGLEPCLRLLPVETREHAPSLAEWRLRPEAWQQWPLDVDDSAQLAQMLAKVAETRRVPLSQARAWGFWQDEANPNEQPVVDAQGLVEVPMWRHALINLPHPLLREGLVILDTPGLNAVGAEPELTVNLIPQAHAVVFLIAADTGVTQSDLAVWRAHLAPSDSADLSRLVVLNKIDTLWDRLSTGQQVHAQIQRQRAVSAQTLGLSVERVLAVSAQKGLVAKIAADDALLRASGLMAFEQALSEGIMGQRQNVLRAAVATGVAHLQTEVVRRLTIRRRDLDDQMAELRSLRGKNSSVIVSMRARIEQEQAEFDASAARIQALRSVQARTLQSVLQSLGAGAIEARLAPLRESLARGGLKLGARKAYVATFEQLRAAVDQVLVDAGELQQMVVASFRALNAEFGFSLQATASWPLQDLARDLAQIERGYLHYLGLGHALQLARADYSQRLIRALAERLAGVFGAAGQELSLWSQSAMVQLDAQWKERKRSFTRRIEAVDRIQLAASSLVERIAEIDAAEQEIAALTEQLARLCQELLEPPVPQPTPAEQDPTSVI